MNSVQPLSQDVRPLSSLPLNDADLSLNNCNWTKGLQAMTDWIWSANLNPYVFPNNLGRFFLQIPSIFEQQLNFSTSLIFDEPSFKNGVQISGFVHRLHKELTISLIAQTRRAWYTMTHHAILGKLTADKHGVDIEVFTNKLYHLSEYNKHSEIYTDLELAIFDFVLAFATNPKNYSDAQTEELKEQFRKYNEQNYSKIDYWLLKKEAANLAKTKALSKNIKLEDQEFKELLSEYTSRVPTSISKELNEQKVNAQIVELAFLCLQFIALASVFTGLNIHDEDFLAEVMVQQLPSRLIEKINELNKQGIEGNTPKFLPPTIENIEFLVKEVANGNITVEPAKIERSENTINTL